MGQFRSRQKVLAKGEFVPLKGTDCLCYLRVQGQDALLVAVNAADTPCKVKLPTGFVPAGESFVLGRWKAGSFTLGERSGLLLCGRMEQTEVTGRYCGGAF